MLGWKSGMADKGVATDDRIHPERAGNAQA